MLSLGIAGAIALALPAPARGSTAPASGTVTAGEARFQVITPTLVRLEYAQDRGFEDRPSITVPERPAGSTAYTVRRSGGDLVIRTRALTLRYREGSGPFSPENLAVRVGTGGGSTIARPEFPPAPGPTAGPPSSEVTPYAVKEDESSRPRTSGNLGGWYRGLDLAGGPVPLHDGVLSRDGWYLLDDTHTALLQDAPPGYAARPGRDGYQDGYLFAYGLDYPRALADLRVLTGAAPLLPRQAFGVWFSRYFAYAQSDYPPLLARFREERLPLDVLMVDTDFKSPHAWNGWGWSSTLFPDPVGFLAWARGEGIAVSLNTHPSLTTDDPRFVEAERRAGRPLTPDPTGIRCRAFVSIGDAYGTGSPGASPDCRVFDWAHAGDQDAYFWLHEPFEEQGIDFWWLDYCCDESFAIAPGLTQDTWINHLYARRNAARGSRWPVLSRVGASVFDPDSSGSGIWAEHRNAIHFTGDARPTWEMLDFQTVFTAAEGNVGIPYVSHDIGGFGAVTSDGTTGRHLPDDLYVRWVQSGAFQPILRLHSDHGDRLPWEYPGRAGEIAAEFLRLRGALVPYVYTLARQAHDSGLPITRPMYLQWPRHDEAYSHDRQYMLGPHLLAAPVGTPGDPATKDVWFPPGEWTDIFTGERHTGPAVEELTVPLERMPVFARAGAVVPTQEHRPGGNAPPPKRLLVDAYPGRRGGFTLYEDAGDGLEYREGQSARTRVAQRRRGGTTTVTIHRARGGHAAHPRRRSYELRILGSARPRTVSVGSRRLRRSGGAGRAGWSYDAERRAVIVRTPPLPTRRTVRIAARRR